MIFNTPRTNTKSPVYWSRYESFNTPGTNTKSPMYWSQYESFNTPRTNTKSPMYWSRYESFNTPRTNTKSPMYWSQYESFNTPRTNTKSPMYWSRYESFNTPRTNTRRPMHQERPTVTVSYRHQYFLISISYIWQLPTGICCSSAFPTHACFLHVMFLARPCFLLVQFCNSPWQFPTCESFLPVSVSDKQCTLQAQCVTQQHNTLLHSLLPWHTTCV